MGNYHAQFLGGVSYPDSEKKHSDDNFRLIKKTKKQIPQRTKATV